MNLNYKLHLILKTPDQQQHLSSFEVPAHIAERYGWEPYDLCVDSMTANLAKGVTHFAAERIDGEREKLASEIAEELTKHILEALKSRDLENGYHK